MFSQLWKFIPHITSIIVITVLLLILMIVINIKIRKANPLEKPKGLLLLVEIFVTTIDGFTINMLGEKLKGLAPYFGFLAIYLFMANTIGLFGLRPPTSNLSVTFSFGLITFLMVRFYGVKFNRWGHVKSLFSPLPLAPINIIGELAVPFSLSIRLFGNILSGTIIMALIYGAIGMGFNALLHISMGGELLTPFTFLVPLLHIYFDLFSGFIQTFVFILLSSVFISGASATE